MIKLPINHEFLRNFFGAENKLKWQDIVEQTLKPSTLQHLSPWLEDVVNERFPIILPRVYPDNHVQWYALTTSDKESIELGELLEAHIGASFTNFDKIPVALNPNDHIERAILDSYGNSNTCKVFRFSATKKQHIVHVFEALGVLRHQLASKPNISIYQSRHRGRILRDINFALHRHDSEQARKYLLELRRAGGIGHQNELFLELRCRAIAGEWREIIEHPELRMVLDLPRPISLTEALMEAVYGYQLLRYEVNDDVFGQRDFFISSLAKGLQGLFAIKQHVRTAGAVKASLLWLLSDTSSDPRTLRCHAEELVSGSICHTDVDRNWIARLLAEFPNLPAERTKDPSPDSANDFTVLQLQAEEEPERTLSKLLSGTWPNISQLEITALAVKCAWMSASIDAMHHAFGLLARLSDDEREQLQRKPGYKRYYQELSKLFVPSTGVSTWHDWLQQVLDDPQWRGAGQVAEDGSLEWQLPAMDPIQFCKLLDKCCDKANETAAQVVRENLPSIVGWLYRHDPISKWQSVWLALLSLLSLDDQSSPEDLIFSLDLCRGYLQGAVSASDYEDLCFYLGELIDCSGAESCDIWLDLLELLVLSQCVAKSKRQVLFDKVYSAFCANPKRFNILQWDALLTFAKEAGISYVQPSEVVEQTEPCDGEPKLATSLNGKKIGIYTLTESVAKRVASQLLALFPKAHIHINSDKVATDSLKALAKEADIFIFAWLSAAHQAYYAIKDARGDKPLLQPQGKGSSSMLRCLLEFDQTK